MKLLWAVGSWIIVPLVGNYLHNRLLEGNIYNTENARVLESNRYSEWASNMQIETHICNVYQDY